MVFDASPQTPPAVYSLCSEEPPPIDTSVVIMARVFRDVRHGTALHDGACPDRGHLRLAGDPAVFETPEGRAFVAAGDYTVIDGVTHMGPEDAGYRTTVRGRFETTDGWPGIRFRIEAVISVEADGVPQ